MQDNTFSSLGLQSEIMQAIEQMGYKEMTEIQRKALPVLLQGGEVVAKAPTGTGKTCAFGIPIDHLPQQLQPRKATESSFLCSTALVRDAMEQVVYNLMMLKTRVLHRVDVPLQQWEVDMMLDNQHNFEKDVTDYAKMPDTVRHVVDQELTLVDSSVKLPHNAAAKALREQIDGFFRFTFEEVALRWESEGVTRKEKEAPRTTLFKAVDYQRGHIDDVQAKNAALSKEVDRSFTGTVSASGAVR